MLRVLTGPMFSGKTTRLLQAVRAAQDGFESRLVAKWARDERAGRAAIGTHDGAVWCAGVQSVGNLDELALPPAPRGRLLVAVDEAQFFGDDLVRLWLRVRQRDAERASPDRRDLLVVAGLDLDFRRQRFGRVLDLVDATASCPDAQVERLVARCAQCGAPAPFSMRTFASEDQVLVGGADAYEAVCEAHHALPRELRTESAAR